MLSTLSGITISTRLVQPSKALSEITAIFSPNVRVVKLSHP